MASLTVRSSLEVILEKVGLLHLLERFLSENVDVDTLLAASDSELSRLATD